MHPPCSSYCSAWIGPSCLLQTQLAEAATSGEGDSRMAHSTPAIEKASTDAGQASKKASLPSLKKKKTKPKRGKKVAEASAGDNYAGYDDSNVSFLCISHIVVRLMKEDRGHNICLAPCPPVYFH